ncbi:MAG: hypothetical protein K6T16_01200 [Candidatus Pacearchaeota archaeon]|nr:hypothetical protein [Candidatus Pacearchaeota archaeon]
MAWHRLLSLRGKCQSAGRLNNKKDDFFRILMAKHKEIQRKEITIEKSKERSKEEGKEEKGGKKEKGEEKEIEKKKEEWGREEDRGIPFELSFRETGRRGHRAFLGEEIQPTTTRTERLEESLKAVEVEKPKSEPVSEGPLYTPIYQEKTEVKYISTTSSEKFAPAEDRELRTLRQMSVREARTPMLREISAEPWEEVTKYEKERVEGTGEFEPTFRYPEKKITKYKARY